MRPVAVIAMRCFNGISAISPDKTYRGLYLDNYYQSNRFLVHIKSLQSDLHVPYLGNRTIAEQNQKLSIPIVSNFQN